MSALRVVVAMSGGVDSSVAAALLKNEGYEVIGATLKLQECQEAQASRSCCGLDGVVRARAVAGQLGIPHFVVDSVREFQEEVLQPAWGEYSNGRTPSPCLLCNEQIKFGHLLRWSLGLGASFLATGHFARVERSCKGEPMLLRGLDPDKDQSYFLAGLNPGQLGSLLFPLGALTKAQVRKTGHSLGLSTADTHDSQDACLVGANESFAEMLRIRFLARMPAGDILDDEGRVLGRHHGVHHFTIGQRKGLGVSCASRRWVREIRAGDAVVVATDKSQNLLSRNMIVRDINWLVPPPKGNETMECQVQPRYRHRPVDAQVTATDDSAFKVIFNEPVQAITPGQAAVFYQGERVLGRGWIDV